MDFSNGFSGMSWGRGHPLAEITDSDFLGIVVTLSSRESKPGSLEPKNDTKPRGIKNSLYIKNTRINLQNNCVRIILNLYRHVRFLIILLAQIYCSTQYTVLINVQQLSYEKSGLKFLLKNIHFDVLMPGQCGF